MFGNRIAAAVAALVGVALAGSAQAQDPIKIGVTQPLTLSITQVRCGPHPSNKREVCGAEVAGTLKRSDFGMKSFLPIVGDEVKLRIQVEARRD